MTTYTHPATPFGNRLAEIDGHWYWLLLSGAMAQVPCHGAVWQGVWRRPHMHVWRELVGLPPGGGIRPTCTAPGCVRPAHWRSLGPAWPDDTNITDLLPADRRILEAVVTAYGLTGIAVLRRASRVQPVMEARQVACYLLVNAGNTVMHAARVLHRDHSTVVNNIAQVRALYLEHAGAIAQALAEPVDRTGAVQSGVEAALHTWVQRNVGAPQRPGVLEYLEGGLMHQRRHSAQLAAYGQVVLTKDAPLREALGQVLAGLGLCQYAWLLSRQVAR